jgi:hypothetical protein
MKFKPFFFALIPIAAFAAGVVINGYRDIPNLSTPSAPASGFVRYYAKGNAFCSETSGAVETCGLGGGGGGGGVIAPASITTLSGSCATVGLQLFTDALYSGAYCNGSTWQYFLAGQALTPPSLAAGSYSWTNQASATLTAQTNGIWTFIYPGYNNGSAHQLNIYDEALPTPPFTTNYRMNIAMTSGNNVTRFGLELRESSTGKIITFGMTAFAASASDCNTTDTTGQNVPCLEVISWSTSGSTNSPVAALGVSQGLVGNAGTLPLCLQVSVATGATGNITMSYSTDNGFTFTQLYQAAKNSYFTTAPTNIGIFGDPTAQPTTAVGGIITVLGIN